MENTVASHDFSVEQIIAACEALQVETAAFIDLNWIVRNDDDSHSLKYWIAKALIAGAKSIKRSQEYAAKARENKKIAETQESGINNFAKYCMQNPAVLKDFTQLLKVAASFDVPVSYVMNMFAKANEVKEELKSA